MDIKSYNDAYKKDKVKALKNIEQIIKTAEEKSREYNIFETVIENPIVNETKTSLAGVPYALKDNFVTKGILTTASSNTLKDFIPVYDSTVYKKLTEAGAILIGKTTLDELALGGTGETCHLGPVKNALNKELISGGSSAGSAVSVALDLVPFSIGSDTGDSIRKPAAYNGIVGYKPSYGLISRYGLIPFASSLDTVGVFSKNVIDAAKVVDVIKGKDEYDMTSVNSSDMNLVLNTEKECTSKNIFYIKELVDMANFEDVTDNGLIKDIIMEYSKVVEKLKENGYTVTGVSIPKELLLALLPSYLVISGSEATSNCSNLTGIIFGPRKEASNINDVFKEYRGDNFCSLIKRRFIIGSFALEKENQEKYFLNAKRVRRLVTDKLSDYFKSYDGLLMPVGNGYIKKINEDYKIKDKMEEALDNNLLFANFGGYPSITLPVTTVNNFPFAVNLTCEHLEDEKLINMACDIEKILKGGRKCIKQ